MTFAHAEAMAAWLMGLKGQAGTFRYAPRQRFGYSTTNIFLATPGYIYGEAISVRGWEGNAPTGLRAGQYFQIAGQLLRIVEAPAFADGSGAATISFMPQLRTTYPAQTAVNFVNPVGVFRLATSDGFGYTLNSDKLCDFGTIEAREAV